MEKTCKNCGEVLDFLKYTDVDLNGKEGKMWISEIWECLECGKKEIIDYEGNICKIK